MLLRTALVTPGTVLALPGELVDLMNGVATCYLSTLMPDGSPQVTHTWVDTDGRNIMITTVIGHQKVKNIQRHSGGALALSSTTNPSRYFEVRGHVTDMTTTGAEEHIETMAQLYLGNPYPKYGVHDQQRLIIRISPRKINVMG